MNAIRIQRKIDILFAALSTTLSTDKHIETLMMQIPAASSIWLARLHLRVAIASAGVGQKRCLPKPKVTQTVATLVPIMYAIWKSHEYTFADVLTSTWNGLTYCTGYDYIVIQSQALPKLSSAVKSQRHKDKGCASSAPQERKDIILL